MVHKTIVSLNTMEVEKPIIVIFEVIKVVILRKKRGFLRVTTHIVALIVNLILKSWVMYLIVQIWVHSELMYYIIMNTSDNSMSSIVVNLACKTERRLWMCLIVCIKA